MNASVNIRALESNQDGYSQSYSDESVRTWDYGIVAGAGADILVSGERFRIDARYHLGRANVRSVEPPLQNVGVTLLFGLAL